MPGHFIFSSWSIFHLMTCALCAVVLVLYHVTEPLSITCPPDTALLVNETVQLKIKSFGSLTPDVTPHGSRPVGTFTTSWNITNGMYDATTVWDVTGPSIPDLLGQTIDVLWIARYPFYTCTAIAKDPTIEQRCLSIVSKASCTTKLVGYKGKSKKSALLFMCDMLMYCKLIFMCEM